MTDEPFYITLASSLAIKLAGNLLDATTRRIRERFSGNQRKQALISALQEGLETSLASFHLEEVNKDHFERLFENFLSKSTVIDEFTQIIDPRPSVMIDLGLLRREFEAEGFDSDTLVYFDFEIFISQFSEAFYNAAAKQSDLQGAIEIGLLRLIVNQLADTSHHIVRMADASEQTANATSQLVDEFSPLMESFLSGQSQTNEISKAIENITKQGFEQIYGLLEKLTTALSKSGYDITLGDGDSIIIGNNNQGETTPDRSALSALQIEITRLRQTVNTHQPSKEDLSIIEDRYRRHIIRWFEKLTFQGMMRTAQAISLPLESVYVDLRAVGEVPEAADTFSVEERRLLLEVDDSDAKAKQELLRHFDTLRRERWGRTSIERKSITETLFTKDKRAFVILGDPGSGKSTLLHLLALVYARGSEIIQKRFKAPEQEANRLPIFVPLAAFDDMLRENPGITLLEFLPKYFDRRRLLPGVATLFQSALESGNALVLLDGLDEVLDSSTRRYVANQVTTMIDEYTPRGVRFALTSRFVGYREAPVGHDIPHLSVLDFGTAEIKTFVHQWSHTYETWVAGGNETPESIRLAHQLEKDLLDDVDSLPSVRRLAANPLMLTMLALLRRQVGRLPHRRIELYKRYMDTMIDNWVEARSHGEREHAINLVDPHQAESLLIPLAYWLQSTQPSGTASKADIQNTLTDITLRERGYDPRTAERVYCKAAEEHAQRFLKEMRNMSGLIVERGYDAYGFLHLTFQEYFAGRALAQMDPETRWKEVRSHLHDPRWREPILLCAGQLGIVEKRRNLVSEFVEQIFHCDDSTENDLHRNLLLALSIACDDVNLEPSLLNNLVTKAMNCLSTNVSILASEIIKRLGQLIVNGVPGAEACILYITDATLIKAVQDFVEYPSIRQAVLQRLDDQHQFVRSSAFKELSTLVFTDADVRQAIFQRLDDQNESVRSSAIGALSALVSTDADVRQAIFQRLNDQNKSVRSSAIGALSSLVSTDADVRQAIFQRLDDQSESVRGSAVDALSSLVSTDADVRQAIFQRLDDQNESIRGSAVDALSSLVSTDADVRQAIFQRLDDQSESVRGSAVDALSSLVSTNADVRQAIFQRVGDQDERVRRYAVVSLSKLDKADILEKDNRNKLVPWLTSRIDEGSIWSNEEEEEYSEAQERLVCLFAEKLASDHSLQNLMLEWLQSPRWHTRLGAVRTLLKWPNGPSREVLQKILESLSDRRGLESYPARLTAAAYLINRDLYSRDAIQLGIDALDYGNLPWEYFPRESGEVRKQAALLLGTLEPIYYDQIVYDKLLHAMKNDQVSSVRDAAYTTLVKLAGIQTEVST